jgi:hypothetical protein
LIKKLPLSDGAAGTDRETVDVEEDDPDLLSYDLLRQSRLVPETNNANETP